MKFRIAIWASAGALAVLFWTVYLSATASSLHGIARVLACVTCPVSFLGHYPLSWYVVLLANAGTYALIGVVVEILRKRNRHLAAA